ncbi:hypothetical protein Scep_024432 [Stephania cephalantha]|uniref:Retrovirus-related Pol polyprotein from transposon RE1 n=1 Tax=Stephania cephalantha TaxID=152367 RepID=A0AAP0EZE3_9MAGN
MCLFLGSNLISWSAKKQCVVARSSTEAEYQALALGVADILWSLSLLKELGLTCPSKPVLWIDSTGTKSLASNPVFHARTKHIEVDVHFIREKVVAGLLELRFVPTASQLANLFTKSLLASRFLTLSPKLNLVVSPRFNLRRHVRDVNKLDHD